MTGEVAARQFGQRLAAIEGPCRRQALVEQRKGVLRALPRATADQAILRTAPQDVDSAIVAGGDPGAFEQRVQLPPRHRPAALQRLDQQRRAAREGTGIELELLETPRRS